jgi:hypothetical protein
VSVATAVLIFAVPIAILFAIAVRDHRAQQARRRGLLDDCAGLFDRYALTHGGDSFPRLAGRVGGRNADVRLVSDSMTIRRLPQLWLQVTVLERLDSARSGLAVLVRPSGYEFYSLTQDFHHILETPTSFPDEVIVRGRDRNSLILLNKLAPALAAILVDPHVKEVAVTGEGLRIIRQAAEGRRGEYLLLRQCVFDDASVAPAMLQSTLASIDTLRTSLVAETPREIVLA